jgi:hypothetical protein
MIAGLATLGGSYLFSALVGAALEGHEWTPGETCTNCDKGRLFYIPIAGPWLALPHADGTGGKALTALLGVAQATGLVLSILGISKFVRSAEVEQAATRFGFDVGPLPGGAQGQLRLRF